MSIDATSLQESPGVDRSASRWREEPTFRALAAATADKAGQEFFRHLVKHLALALNVEYAFVAEFAGSPARVRTIALWGQGDWADNVEYDLDGTPCQEVLRGSLCLHSDGVQERFPRDRLLVDMGARSFLGVPLRDGDGRTLGHLAVIDTEPIPEDPRVIGLFRAFADRARVELERLRAEESLRRVSTDLEVRLESTARSLQLAHSELEALLEINRAAATHLEREALFRAVADAIGRVLPVDRVAVLVPDAEKAVVNVYAVHGAVKLFEGDRVPEGSIPAWVIENRRHYVVSWREDVRESFPASYEVLTREQMDSVIVLPLLFKDRCLGALSLMAQSRGTWDDAPQRLLDEIAASVAVALDDCLAYEQIQRLDREHRALLDVNVAAARYLRRDELFNALAGCLRDLVPSERIGIELAADGETLEAHVLTPQDPAAAPARVERLPSAGTACRWVEQNRRWFIAATRDELRDRFPVTFAVMSREGMESLCAVPLLSGDRCRGVLFFMAARQGAFAEARRGLLDQVASAVAVALDNCLAHEEVERLRDRLAAENLYLQEEIRIEHHFEEIVGGSPALREALRRVEQVAGIDTTVLILGETGTGKELFARAIHSRSRRSARPLVKVNCGTIPAGLVESELFGHVKGAFTGALQRRIGRFELADGGTIFLDEIGELPLDMQVKLLRVLQDQEFEPVGSSRTLRVDVRVIAATNRDLWESVRQGKFRSDLLYRLNVFPIPIPPLRDRRADIPLLVGFLLTRLARQLGKPLDGFSRRSMDRLMAYSWPGNVRELQNVVERAAILASGSILDLEESLLGSTPGSASQTDGGHSLEDVERRHILDTLKSTGGLVEGPRGAASILGLHPNTLRSRMKKLGIARPRHEVS